MKVCLENIGSIEISGLNYSLSIDANIDADFHHSSNYLCSSEYIQYPQESLKLKVLDASPFISTSLCNISDLPQTLINGVEYDFEYCINNYGSVAEELEIIFLVYTKSGKKIASDTRAIKVSEFSACYETFKLTINKNHQQISIALLSESKSKNIGDENNSYMNCFPTVNYFDSRDTLKITVLSIELCPDSTYFALQILHMPLDFIIQELSIEKVEIKNGSEAKTVLKPFGPNGNEILNEINHGSLRIYFCKAEVFKDYDSVELNFHLSVISNFEYFFCTERHFFVKVYE